MVNVALLALAVTNMNISLNLTLFFRFRGLPHRLPIFAEAKPINNKVLKTWMPKIIAAIAVAGTDL